MNQENLKKKIERKTGRLKKLNNRSRRKRTIEEGRRKIKYSGDLCGLFCQVRKLTLGRTDAEPLDHRGRSITTLSVQWGTRRMGDTVVSVLGVGLPSDTTSVT